jgi:hypothetical protein
MECLLIIQADKRIPEEVLGSDELLQVWQKKHDKKDAILTHCLALFLS